MQKDKAAVPRIDVRQLFKAESFIMSTPRSWTRWSCHRSATLSSDPGIRFSKPGLLEGLQVDLAKATSIQACSYTVLYRYTMLYPCALKLIRSTPR